MSDGEGLGVWGFGAMRVRDWVVRGFGWELGVDEREG